MVWGNVTWFEHNSVRDCHAPAYGIKRSGAVSQQNETVNDQAHSIERAEQRQHINRVLGQNAHGGNIAIVPHT